MFVENFYVFLRYLLIIGIVYFILRYTPYINLDQNKALLTAILFIILCLVFEFIYEKINIHTSKSNSELDKKNNTEISNVDTIQEKLKENFSDCDSCGGNDLNIEKFNSTLKQGNSCRIVCDNNQNNQINQNTQNNQNNRKESFENSINNSTEIINKIPQFDIGYDSNVGFVSNNNCSPDSIKIQNQLIDYNNTWPKYRYGDNSDSGEKEIVMNQNINDFVPPYQDFNLLPVFKDYKSLDSDYGYSFMQPEKWYSNRPKTSLCTTDTRPPIVPNFTDALPLDFKSV